MTPSDLPPIHPIGTPPAYPLELTEVMRESSENIHLESFIPHHTRPSLESPPHHENVPLLPSYRSLEETDLRIGHMFKLLEDEKAIKERIHHLTDMSEDFINYVLVKRAGALQFQGQLSDKEKEDKIVEYGLQFLRSDTIEWQMDFASFLDLSSDSSPASSGASHLDFAVAMLNTLGHAGSIFLMGIHLTKGKEVLAAKRQAIEHIKDVDQKKQLQAEIDTLESWVESNTNVIKKGLKSEALAFAITTPKLISALVSLVAGAGTKTAAVFDWVGLGVDLVGSAFRLKKAHSDRKRYALWAEAFKGSELTSDKMRDLLAKQKSGHERKVASNYPKLEAKTNEILQRQYEGKEFALIVVELKKLGWTIPPEIAAFDQLEAFVKIPENQAAANENMVRFSEGISASLRNAFRALAAKKASIDAGFVKLRLNRARGLFTSATILTGLVIALKVAVAAGVVIAAGALVVTGYGMLAAIAGAIIIGGIYLRVKKPNLFKVHWKGTKSKLIFRKIPQIIQNFRLQRTTMESSKLATSLLVKKLHKRELELLLDSIGSGKEVEISEELKGRVKALKKVNDVNNLKNILTKALKDLNRKIEKEKSKFDILQKKIGKLGESVSHHESKAKALRKELEEAGWKDFLWHLGKEHGDAYGEGVVDNLAEHLMADSDLLDDPDTRELLDHLKINLDAIKNLPDANERMGEVAEAIRSFFGSDDEEMIKKIREGMMVVMYGKGREAAA